MTTGTGGAPSAGGAGEGGNPHAPPIPTGEWTRLDSGGGPAGAYFYRSVVIEGGSIWMGWGFPDEGPERGNFLFDPIRNQWLRTNDVSHDPTKNIGVRENYGAWYDGERHAVWVGDGTPVSYGNPDGPQSGDMQYDIAADTFRLAYPNYGTNVKSIGRGDGALVYHQNALYSFGGWSVGSGQRLVKHDLVSDEVTAVAESTTPSLTQDPARLSYARSGIDTRTGELWTLADDGELYELDPLASSPSWVHVPTTGEKPGNHNFGAALHEAGDVVVAYLGIDGMVNDDNGPEVGDTWLLDLTTKEWRYGPRHAQGDPVPRLSTLAVAVMNYDHVNARVVITVSTSEGCEVWAFTP